MLLDGTKDEHFSYFHSSCQLGILRQIALGLGLYLTKSFDQFWQPGGRGQPRGATSKAAE